MLYQAQVWYARQQQWMVLGGLMNSFANALRLCWTEQEVWRRYEGMLIPDCRIAIVVGNEVQEYAFVPWDQDFNDPYHQNDEIIVHRWRCAVQSADISGKASKMFDAMMQRN